MHDLTIEGYSVSPQQRHLWLLQQADGDQPYGAQCEIAIQGDLDPQRLEAAAAQVVAEHEILRTIFRRLPSMTVPFQVITEQEPLWHPAQDLRDRTPDEQLAATKALRAELRRSASPQQTLQLLLVRLGADSYRLLIDLPALCADTTTLHNLPSLISAAYAAELEEAAAQYADVAELFNELLVSEEAADCDYWAAQHLADAPALGLLSEAAAEPRQPYTPRCQSLTIDSELREQIEQLAAAHDTTVQIVLLACWQALLWQLSRRPSITVAVAYDRRLYDELENTLGLFERYLPIQGQINHALPFQASIAQLTATVEQAAEWQDFFTWEQIDQNDAARARFPEFGFAAYQHPAPLTAAGLQWSLERATAYPDRFNVLLACRIGDTLALDFHYDSMLYPAGGGARLALRYEMLLHQVVAAPATPIAELDSLSLAERQTLLTTFNQTQRDLPELDVVGWFEQQVARTPDRLAVVAGDRSLSYAALNSRADQLAYELQRRGVGPEILVGIYMHRSIDLVVAVWGVLKAGGAYLPLDPAYPSQRLEYILRETGAPLVVAQRDLLTSLPANHAAGVIALDADWPQIATQPQPHLPSRAQPQNLAYVIYTSGSTGTPKGVMLTRVGLLNYLAWAVQAYHAPDDGVVPVHSPLGFDLTVTSLFVPLLTGQCVRLLAKEQGIEDLASLLTQTTLPPSLVKLTPAHLDGLIPLFADQAPRPTALVIGGEALYGEQLQFWRSNAPTTRLFNEYGPTEAVVGCCVHQVAPDEQLSGPVPIGRPIANTQLYVLDSRLRPTPLGVPGELYIGGTGVARGYLNRPDLTAERFVPHPFSETPGERLYKTGDLTRYRDDGTLFFLGRNDDQVKLRGYRIELGEIEAILLQYPALQHAVVLLQEPASDTAYLQAFVVPKSGQQVTTDELQRFLAARLPEYMAPSSWIVLEQLPLTANGKVDRAALAAGSSAGQTQPGPYVAPRTSIEAALVEIWGDVLGQQRISIYDSFFVLGGHSLLATQVISRLRAVFKVSMQVRSLFNAPTIAELAQEIERALTGAPAEVAPITPVAREQRLPLSSAQRRLWFLDQLQPGSIGYNVATVVRLSGPLQIAALKESLEAIVQRHEVLRTTFVVDEGQPAQAIAAVQPVDLPVVDLRELPPETRDSQTQQLIQAEIRRPFDLARGPLLRVRAFQISAQEHLLILVMHHIVTDGWSMGVLFQEVVALYQQISSGRPWSLPDLPIQYADFAAWQQQWLASADRLKQLDYWQRQLGPEGAPVPALNLPTDYPRPAVQTFSGASYNFGVSAELTHALKLLSRREGVTLFMTLLAGFQTLLYRYTGQDDIAVGTPIANRNRAELEGLIGCFINSLVLRTKLGDSLSFRDVLQRVRQVALEAYAHQDIPFEQIVETLQVDRDLSRNPLFQVMFVLQNMPMPAVSLPELTLSVEEIDSGTTRLDLIMTMQDSDQGLHGSLLYNTDLFAPTTITTMQEHFVRLLEGVVAQPDAQILSLRFTDDQRQPPADALPGLDDDALFAFEE